MSDLGKPKRNAGHTAGHSWASEHFQHEKAVLGRLFKLRNAAADAGRDLADQLQVTSASGIPEYLHEVMRKAPPASPDECVEAWRGTVGGADGYTAMRDPQFAAGFVEGAAEVWEQYLEDRRA
jgi:hypothetical protein